MVGARKGPHRPLGFAFGCGAPNCEPIPDSEKRARAVYAALRQSERFVFSQLHSKRQTPLQFGNFPLQNGLLLSQLAGDAVA